MRLKPEQLSASFKKGLLPVYLIGGDEPLQVGEAADEVRMAAKQAGFLREVITIDSGHEWPLLRQQTEALSIFADQKLIDLRLTPGKVGTEGSKALIAYCQQAAAEHILLITTDKLDAAVLKSQWMLALDKVGVIVQVWPLQGAELQDWLLRRAARKGMKLEADAVKALAARVEGNLLAAAQEIEKLYILHGASTIGRAKVDDLVADSARFDVFKLTDALLQGKLQRSLKILQALKAEDVAAPIVLWALSREIRLLLALQTAGHQPGIYKKYQVTERRRPLLEKALSRFKLRDLQNLLQCCAITDLQIKGELSGDCWESLLSLCWMLVDPAVTDRYVRFA